MSWLSRIDLGADTIEATAAADRLGLDSYGWHKRSWAFFLDSSSNQSRDFLTRIDFLEGRVRLWILSERQPAPPTWCPREAFAVRKLAPSFLGHRYYAFDLLANPVRVEASTTTDGSRRLRANGRRHSKRQALISPTELRQWIDRKGAESGFMISEAKPLEIGRMIESHFKKNGKPGSHGGVQFRGVLEVTDAAKFAVAYRTGIGPAKAFGFGLLLLAPVNV